MWFHYREILEITATIIHSTHKVSPRIFHRGVPTEVLRKEQRGLEKKTLEDMLQVFNNETPNVQDQIHFQSSQ